MEIRELRIGNYINDRGLNVKLCRSMFVNILQGLYLDCYKPIPLTEEILLKCGFEREGEFHYWVKGFLIWMPTKSMFVHDKTGVTINHLNQLQNLYFSLTGKELEINL